jgi:hypothetical protein
VRTQTSLGNTVQLSFVPVLHWRSLVRLGLPASSEQMPGHLPPEAQPLFWVQVRLLSLLQKPRHSRLSQSASSSQEAGASFLQ